MSRTLDPTWRVMTARRSHEGPRTMDESHELPLHPCTLCGGVAELVSVRWAQPRYQARCTLSRHYDPTQGREHTAVGRTPDEAQAVWNQLNPVPDDA
jgi:hypothetical protein